MNETNLISFLVGKNKQQQVLGKETGFLRRCLVSHRRFFIETRFLDSSWVSPEQYSRFVLDTYEPRRQNLPEECFGKSPVI
jgi:hypothetical protein